MAPEEPPDDPAERRSEQLRRRMKAARALADITVEQLAQRIGGRGLGPKTLYNIERGERSLQPREIAAIAQACGVPPEFFTVDLEAALSAPESMTGRLAAVEEAQRQQEHRHEILSKTQDLLGETVTALGAKVEALRRELRGRRQDG